MPTWTQFEPPAAAPVQPAGRLTIGAPPPTGISTPANPLRLTTGSSSYVTAGGSSPGGAPPPPSCAVLPTNPRYGQPGVQDPHFASAADRTAWIAANPGCPPPPYIPDIDCSLTQYTSQGNSWTDDQRSQWIGNYPGCPVPPAATTQTPPPTQVSPADGGTVTTGYVAFTFTPDSTAGASQVNVCTGPNGTGTCVQTQGNAGDTSISVQLVPATYYWAVSSMPANGVGGWGPYGAYRQVIVAPAGGGSSAGGGSGGGGGAGGGGTSGGTSGGTGGGSGTSGGPGTGSGTGTGTGAGGGATGGTGGTSGTGGTTGTGSGTGTPAPGATPETPGVPIVAVLVIGGLLAAGAWYLANEAEKSEPKSTEKPSLAKSSAKTEATKSLPEPKKNPFLQHMEQHSKRRRSSRVSKHR